jgi:hypothetical protein
MSILGALRTEANLIADFRLTEVMAIVERNRAQGRIWALRRHKAYAINEIERQYLAVLHRYVHYKIQRQRRDFRIPESLVRDYREDMARLEALITGEPICESDAFLLSGHFSQ